MMGRALAERAVDRWVRFYTFALPGEIADERRSELRSDLWEQRASGRRGFEVVRRALEGAPADVVWRIAKGIVAPWLRTALRLAASAVVLFTLAEIQHLTGRHTFIGNAMYVSWFICAFGAVGAALVGSWRRYRK